MSKRPAGTSHPTKERIIATTAQLMRSHGYTATSFRQIAAAANTPIGSMYFHFPGGKEELVTAATIYAGKNIGALLKIATKDLPAHEAIRSLSAAMTHVLLESDWTDGCPIAMSAIESPATSAPVRSAADTVFREWEALIAARLREEGVQEAEAAALATAVLSGLEGGLLLARARHDLAPMTAITNLLVTSVQKATNHPGTDSPPG